MSMSVGLLASILQSQGNLGSGTKELYERSLVSDIKKFGPEGINTAIAHSNLGTFYHLRAEGSHTAEMRKENLLLLESKYKEALRIYVKVLGPDNLRTIYVSSIFSLTSRKLYRSFSYIVNVCFI
jgi:hypothetical protein